MTENPENNTGKVEPSHEEPKSTTEDQQTHAHADPTTLEREESKLCNICNICNITSISEEDAKAFVKCVREKVIDLAKTARNSEGVSLQSFSGNKRIHENFQKSVKKAGRNKSASEALDEAKILWGLFNQDDITAPVLISLIRPPLVSDAPTHTVEQRVKITMVKADLLEALQGLKDHGNDQYTKFWTRSLRKYLSKAAKIAETIRDPELTKLLEQAEEEWAKTEKTNGVR